jgi:6-phosphofructokinase
LDYWMRDTLRVPEASARLIRQYLGVFRPEDTVIKRNQVQPIQDEERKHLLDYAKHSRTPGQTPDDLRTAGLKLISKVLEKTIREDPQMIPRDYWKNFRVLTNEPRHLIRAIAPTSSDILLSQRLGTLAVDGAMAGYTDFMISQWLTEYVMVPLRLVILGRKRVPAQGIFYRSAIASTGQPADLI